MRLRTTIQTGEPQRVMSYQDYFMLMGSCFSTNIGQKLAEHQLNSFVNPSGILYDPLSIANTINKLLDAKSMEEYALVKQDGLWHSYDHHGSFSSLEKEALISRIEEVKRDALQYLSKTKWLIITLGTVFVYRLKTTNQVVANCHKVPQQQFNRERISVDQITEVYSRLFEKLFAFNPNLSIILTVSPVRHIKNGLVENNRSKSCLLLASDKLSKLARVQYFPSYEMVIDDLRDYRFYKEDLIHPSSQAIEYIWEHFVQYFFDMKSQDVLKKVAALNKDLQHRPIHDKSEANQIFQAKLAEKKAKMIYEYPELNW